MTRLHGVNFAAYRQVNTQSSVQSLQQAHKQCCVHRPAAMPALKVLGVKYHIGSDDVPVFASFGALFHAGAECWHVSLYSLALFGLRTSCFPAASVRLNVSCCSVGGGDLAYQPSHIKHARSVPSRGAPVHSHCRSTAVLFHNRPGARGAADLGWVPR